MPHHGGSLLEPKTDKKSIVFFEEAPGLVSVRLIHPVLTTYASKPIRVYLIKSYITQTMFCIASSRPSLIPPIIRPTNYCLRPRAYDHDRSLPERLTHLTDCNFIIRMLFYQVY